MPSSLMMQTANSAANRLAIRILESIGADSTLTASDRCGPLDWLQGIEAAVSDEQERLLLTRLRSPNRPCQLTTTLLCVDPVSVASGCMSRRLYWFVAHPSFPKQWSSIVSSHSGRVESYQPEWIAALYDAMHAVNRAGQAVMQSHATPVGSQVLFAAARLGIPNVELHVADGKQTMVDWLRERIEAFGNRNANSSLRNVNQAILYVSPPLIPSDHEPFAKFPAIDRMLVMLAQHVHAIRLRRKGKTAQLLEARLKMDEPGSSQVFVSVCNQQGESNAVARHLMEQGAVGRYCEVSTREILLGQSTIQSLFGVRDCFAPIIPRLPMIRAGRWEYLTHCTRSRWKNWPDQSEDQFSDEWLMSQGIETFGPIASLIRIVRQQRLLATTHLKRSSVATVSLSALPLDELLAKRSFQSHLGRWDWEPFGICIRRDWLEQRGAREVLYLPSDAYDKLDAVDQVFFQPAAGHGDSERRWESEQEWRVAGDLRLNAIPAEAALVFVPNSSFARLLSPICRWPIVVVGE